MSFRLEYHMELRETVRGKRRREEGKEGERKKLEGRAEKGRAEKGREGARRGGKEREGDRRGGEITNSLSSILPFASKHQPLDPPLVSVCCLSEDFYL